MSPTGNDAFNGLFKVLLHDTCVEVSGGYQGRLVAHIGDVSAREAGRVGRHLPRQVLLVHLRLQRLQVHLEYGCSGAQNHWLLSTGTGMYSPTNQ